MNTGRGGYAEIGSSCSEQEVCGTKRKIEARASQQHDGLARYSRLCLEALDPNLTAMITLIERPTPDTWHPLSIHRCGRWRESPLRFYRYESLDKTSGLTRLAPILTLIEREIVRDRDLSK